MKNQIIILVTTVILTVMVIFAAVILGNNLNDRSREISADLPSNSNTKPTAISNPTLDTIAEKDSPETTSIPGYELIRMKSGQLDQSVRLYNPSENSCYFLITIYLPDGKEIYRSDLIAPGDSIDRIRISAKLEKGTTENAMLVYSCYSVGNLQPMNGATVKFTLEVT